MMKIETINPGGLLVNTEKGGMLNPDFESESLMQQLLPLFEKLSPVRNKFERGVEMKYLVFDKDEELCLMNLLSLLAGGFIFERGMGHGSKSGEVMLLDAFLEPTERTHIPVPSHRERDQLVPMVDIKDWSLAIR